MVTKMIYSTYLCQDKHYFSLRAAQRMLYAFCQFEVAFTFFDVVSRPYTFLMTQFDYD